MPSRQHYVASRIGARMQQRGEKMLLRRTTISSGPVPYRNPPDVSADLHVVRGSTVNGQAFLGLAGTSAIGRLVAGDQIQTLVTLQGLEQTTWTVGVMPSTVQTDSDGIVVLDGAGAPVIGIPAVYTPDSRADRDGWKAVPVTAPSHPDPAASVGSACLLVCQGDQVVYGVPLSFDRLVTMGWTEVDSIGLRLAAYYGGPIQPPKVDDLLVINGMLRSVISVGQVFGNGVQFAYVVQAR